MNIKKAGLDDIDALIKLRIDYLSIDKELTQEEQEDIRQNLHTYLNKYIPDDGFFAYIAEDNGRAVSAAFLSVAERPPRYTSSSLTGTVYNVFTYPEFRRRGIAAKVMTALMDEAQKLNVVHIDLLATKDGKYLYEKLGFSVPDKYVYMKESIGRN